MGDGLFFFSYSLSNPLVDLVLVEAPARTHSENRNLVSADHPINRGRVNAQILSNLRVRHERIIRVWTGRHARDVAERQLKTEWLNA